MILRVQRSAYLRSDETHLRIPVPWPLLSEYALPMARLPPGTYRLTVAYRVGETLVQRHVVIEIQ